MIYVFVLALLAMVGNVFSFAFGARIGQRAAKGEEIKVPNPVEALREERGRRETEREADRLLTVMRNIEAYDGTPGGQKDVPSGGKK